jgi:DNA adenine methylase
MKIKPCLRWVGGKTQLIPQLLEHVPPKYEAYHEPFLGGAALFFALAPERAFLTDVNPTLINAYCAIQSDIQMLVMELRKFERSANCFYEQRRLLNEYKDHQVITSARFIYLNKTCFNGLWRENAKGEFNVPYGGDRRGKVIDESNLLSCSIALQKASVFWESFERCETRVQKGDLVYFDPPYLPVSSNSFVDYTSDGFGKDEHVKLRDLARRLKKKGAHVILSNSDTPLTRDLYADFELREVKARRSVNSNGQGRGKVGELIIT